MKVWLPYTQMHTAPPPLEIVATQGVHLILANGHRLTDSVASWWTACHGYNHPHILQAIQQQSVQMAHVMMGGLLHPQAHQLAQRLLQLTDHHFASVFYSESGSTAIEIAMKMALQYWMHQKNTQKTQFLCFEHGYHGDTFYAMSVCDPKEGMHHLFHSVLPVQYCKPLPITDVLLERLDTWLAQHSSQIAALIIEPLVQGAGGMKMHTSTVLKKVCTLAKKHHLLVIMDEIFTGFYRTGQLFAHTQESIPDILCLSKALTGGTLPLATTLANHRIYNAFLSEHEEHALMHGTTFMGNALACSAANASLDLFERAPYTLHVRRIAEHLDHALSPLTQVPGVKAVRVLGAIGVVQLARPLSSQEHQWVTDAFVKQGIWNRPLGDIIYTTPALNIDAAPLQAITEAMGNVVTQWSQQIYTKECKQYDYL